MPGSNSAIINHLTLAAPACLGYPYQMTDLDALLNARGITQNFGAYVTAAAFTRNGRHAGFGLGDGTIKICDFAAWSSVAAHQGAVLCLAPEMTGHAFLSGGDDGALRAVGSDGVISEFDKFGSKWVEHVTSWVGPKSAYAACTVGKTVHLFDAGRARLRTFDHPSTVTGIAFDAKGKRLAASHYNGASLWFVASNTATPNAFEWKGSHTGIALHPNGDALVTSMQENALHGWTLPEKKHMRMSGYPAKTESFGFTKSGRWLATAGADAIVLWPFFGGGPMGKPPMELAGGDGAIIKRIACHPELEIVAAGFDNGLVLVADTLKEKILAVCAPGRGAVSALCWNPSGSHLALGTSEGFAAVVDFSGS